MPFNWTEIDQKFTDKGLTPLDSATKTTFDKASSFDVLNAEYNEINARRASSADTASAEEKKTIKKAFNAALLAKNDAQTALEKILTTITTLVNTQVAENQAAALYAIIENMWASLPLAPRLNILAEMMKNTKLVNLISVPIEGNNVADLVLPSVTDFSALTIDSNTNASMTQNISLFNFIFPKVQNPNVIDANGNNALTVAVRQNIPSMVKKLLEAGAQIDKNDNAITTTLINNFHKSTTAVTDFDGPTEITLSLWLTGSFTATNGMSKFINNIPEENIHHNPREDGYSIQAENAMKIITLLSEHGLDINHFNEQGMNLFCLASHPMFVNNAWMIDRVMSMDSFNINAQTKDGANLFTWGCQNKNTALALKVLSHADFNLNINIQDCAQFIANLEADTAIKIVENLLSKGQDINAQNQLGETLFYLACKAKNADLALMIAKHLHFDVSVVTSQGDNALIAALDYLNDLKILDALDARLVHLSIKNFQGFDAFSTAIYHNKLDMVKWVHDHIKLNNPITSDSGIYPLHLAVTKGHLEIVTWLLDNGYNPNQTTSNNKKITPLQLALALPDTTENKTSIIEILTDHGATESVEIADENKQSDDGKTPFMLLCAQNMTEMALEELGEEAFDVTIVDNTGKGPIHHAVFLSDADGAKTIIKGCVDKGADINARDCLGRTPLSEAIYSGKPDMATTLLDLSADPMIPDNNGAYPIHIAAGKGQISTLAALVTKGVEVDYPSSNHLKDTPLQIAKKHAPAELKSNIVAWLLAHGATDVAIEEVAAPIGVDVIPVDLSGADNASADHT